MKYFISFVILVVVSVIIGSLFFIGSPKEERMRRFDETRVQDLSNLQWQIVEYWQAKKKLPAELSVLNDPLRNIIVPTDPETQVAYGYEPKGDLTFALCATFATAQDTKNPSTMARPVSYAPYGGILDGDNWQHGTGYVCFERTIDPDFFKQPSPLLK
ncbi:MAG TPA: hypothetical protein VEA18_00390 [Candidatus Kapabacteria bacterium]|nr:hypothetical protein [Candidatus Kapabacteria bacterium]